MRFKIGDVVVCKTTEVFKKDVCYERHYLEAITLGKSYVVAYSDNNYIGKTIAIMISNDLGDEIWYNVDRFMTKEEQETYNQMALQNVFRNQTVVCVKDSVDYYNKIDIWKGEYFIIRGYKTEVDGAEEYINVFNKKIPDGGWFNINCFSPFKLEKLEQKLEETKF